MDSDLSAPGAAVSPPPHAARSSAPAAAKTARLRRWVVTTMAPPAVRDHETSHTPRTLSTRPEHLGAVPLPPRHLVLPGGTRSAPGAGRAGRPVRGRGLRQRLQFG